MKKFYKNLEEKRKIIRNYIHNHPTSTATEIKRVTGIKVEKAYRDGIREAYKDAKVKFPKHFIKRDKKQRRKLVINYIRKNPNASLTEIEKNLKLRIFYLFGGIRNAFKSAGVKYTRDIKKKQQRELKKKKIIVYIRENPLTTHQEIYKKFGIDIYKLFGSLKNAYKLAGVKWLDYHQKRKARKQEKIIEYIKNNLNVTQWEINKACKTHVQEIFEGGIKEAYKKAGIKYPLDRRNVYGTAKKEIKDRSIRFENDVLDLLNKIGVVKRHIKTKHGIVDAILTTNEKVFVIEVKNYQSKPISYPEIKQIDKYLTDLNYRNGIIICSKKNVKNKFQIGSHRIFIRTKDDILKEGVVV